MISALSDDFLYKKVSLRTFDNCSVHCSNSCIHAVVRLCGENGVNRRTQIRIQTV
jgi:hypothetical protein